MSAQPPFRPESCGFTLTFTHFPREIRDEIYANLLLYHDKIHIPTTYAGSALQFLARRLPYSLLVNHQVLKEVTEVYFGRSTIIAESNSLPALENLLDQFSDDVAWKNVRHLEFTKAQESYATGGDEAMNTPANCVHDIALRCPGLRKLSISFQPSVLVKSRDVAWTSQHLANHEFEQITNLTRVLENRNLIHFSMTVDCSSQRSNEDVRMDWGVLVEECTALLDEDIVKSGRTLEVERRVKSPKTQANFAPQQWRHVYSESVLDYDHPLF